MATNTGKIDYSPELGEAIATFVMEGGTVREFCAQPDTPNKSTVFRWLDRHPEFAARYTAARLMQADALADELIDIADGTGLKPGEVYDARRVRQQLSSRMWLAERLAPKRYGAKQALERSAGLATTTVVVRAYAAGPAGGGEQRDKPKITPRSQTEKQKNRAAEIQPAMFAAASGARSGVSVLGAGSPGSMTSNSASMKSGLGVIRRP